MTDENRKTFWTSGDELTMRQIQEAGLAIRRIIEAAEYPTTRESIPGLPTVYEMAAIAAARLLQYHPPVEMVLVSSLDPETQAKLEADDWGL
jgi:hypothetical protein